jgi:hypothetical protein
MEEQGVSYKQMFEYGKRLCDASDKRQKKVDRDNAITLIALVVWLVIVMLTIT